MNVCVCSIELNELPEVKTAAHMTRSICYQNKAALLAGIIVGGWDRKNGGSVYAITLGGSMVKQDFSVGGSGSTYIYGYCDANYRPGMSRAECQEFVKNGTLRYGWATVFRVLLCGASWPNLFCIGMVMGTCLMMAYKSLYV